VNNMPLTTRIFNWHDGEFRLADEIYVAVAVGLTALMIIGFFMFTF
jgi:hypothetical protein